MRYMLEVAKFVYELFAIDNIERLQKKKTIDIAR